MNTWLFFDYWHIEHQDNLALRQGIPNWRAEATYEDPTYDSIGFWPTVYRDENAELWRMLYFAINFPLTFMAAESEDGIHWRPSALPNIRPGGTKVAPNHIFTVPSASGGPIYIDPIAADGYRFKVFCTERGGPNARKTSVSEESFFNKELRQDLGLRPSEGEHIVAVSADGLHWQMHPTLRWGWPAHPTWHPESPITCFYSSAIQQHVLITRPGWGDRRQVVRTSPNLVAWSDPALLWEPDPLDPPQSHFYGMPVFPYEGLYVGMLWTGHFASSQRLERFNQMQGTVDSQLAYSFDGLRFQRGLRQPFVPLNEPGLQGSGIIYPTCLVQTERELRIYSAASRILHGHYMDRPGAEIQRSPRRAGEKPTCAVTMHTLRIDGFMYLASLGNWASFISKPMILNAPALSLNVLAPLGEVAYQICDMESRPVEGFTFADCVPFRQGDALNWSMAWRSRSLTELMGKVIRLEFKLRNARLYALRGDFHFADATDVILADDDLPIDEDLFDF
jgi:hypothetical protein